MKLIGLISLALFGMAARGATVGSKIFTESYVLAEIAARKLSTIGVPVDRRFGLGATGIAYQSLISGAVDLYPEYTGTIGEAILKEKTRLDWPELKRKLDALGLTVTNPLGFNNTYGIAVRGDLARSLRLKRISDLAKHPELNAGFSHEFMARSDGYEGLKSFYQFGLANKRRMEHSLAYEAIAAHSIDLTDVYSTDAKIGKLGLVVLEDDKGFFPAYLPVYLARKEFAEKNPAAWTALQSLAGTISTKRMIELNALVELEGKTVSQAATTEVAGSEEDESESALGLRTKQHLRLVGFSLLAATLVGLPLGIACARFALLGRAILLFSSLVQTIPSLALLCFLIPVFGIGTKPALVALFLYGLLPIVLGVYTGIQSIDPRMREVAKALGLSRWQRLSRIELPLASRSILAGLKTSAIIGIGTATLAALIGAGGYGAIIVMGLTLNDHAMILNGAIPSAGLAVAVYALFEILERFMIPKGLRN